jgi:hypothetical protein
MFLRATTRKKDGKVHRYFSVVENKRVRGGFVVQRHVLHLGRSTPRRNSSRSTARRCARCRKPVRACRMETRARAFDYDVEIDRHYYSVPHALVGQEPPKYYH